MRLGSVFSGLGGFGLGFERAGCEVVWQIESNQYCRDVLERHWPHVKRYGDVYDVYVDEIPEVDIICGGFPCQPTSMIGSKEAVDDERWLWPEYARIIDGLRPRYVVVENPTGILVRGLGDVLGELATLGYDAEWAVLEAGRFGARHKRDRTFVVAYPAGTRLEGRNRETTKRRQEPVLRASALPESPDRWDVSAPLVCRTSDGVSDRVERTRALGNAVVPQLTEWLATQILKDWKQHGTVQGT